MTTKEKIIKQYSDNIELVKKIEALIFFKSAVALNNKSFRVITTIFDKSVIGIFTKHTIALFYKS